MIIIGKSKVYNTFKDMFSNESYIMIFEGKIDMGEGAERIIMTIASKEDNIYMDVKSENSHATIMYKDDVTYVISNDQKMYMTKEGKDKTVFNDMTLMTKEDLEEIKNKEYETGKESIDEVEYEYEEYKNSEEDIIERYYFKGDELKYIKSIDKDGKEEIMKVIKISSEVEEKIFEIPSEYKKMEE